jgi:MoxR-like ATPase
MEIIEQWASALKRQISERYKAKGNTLDYLLTALCCGGHVLLEDKPGTGKTVLARTLADLIGGSFSQISCTPDLLPSDIIGVSIYDEEKEAFTFRKGPLISHVVLVDEINRATPRSQSALLEAIAEGQVSIEGKTLKLPNPFFLLATESPVETEGTFPLPEAQKDRFFMTLSPGYPDREAEREIMRNENRPSDNTAVAEKSFENLDKVRKSLTAVHVAPSLRNYILDLVERTRNDHRLVYGVSPRGSLALYKGAQALAGIRGRSYVSPEEIRDLAVPVFRKRILLRPEQIAQGMDEMSLLKELVSGVEIPLGNRET